MKTSITNESNVKRSSNDFSFVDVISQAVHNTRYKQGYYDLKAGKDNENSYIWAALSAIGQNTGEAIYENILNYIDLASNIDLCKISVLRSMLKMHGINYSIFDGLNMLPTEIEHIIDVLSINKKYLQKAGVLDKSFYQSDLMMNTLSSSTNSLSSVAEVLYKNIQTEISVDINHAVPTNTISCPDNINGIYSLKKEYAYKDYAQIDNVDSGRKPLEILSSNIAIYREYINESTLQTSISSTGEQVSNYFSIKKYAIKLYDENELNPQYTYGLFYNTDINTYGDTTKNVYSKLIGVLGNIELSVNQRTKHEIKLQNCFNYDINFKAFDEKTYSGIISANNGIGNNSESTDNGSDDTNSNDINSNTNSGDTTTESSETLNDESNATSSTVTVSYTQNLYNLFADKEFMDANKYKYVYANVFMPTRVLYKNIIIDDDKYFNWLSGIFYNTLSSFCYMCYTINGEEDKTLPIYDDIRSELSTIIINDAIDLSSEVRIKKLRNNVSQSFNEKSIADDIENGLDSLDNYTGIHKELIESELMSRYSALSTNYNDNTTKVSYYRQQKVKEYFRFIQDTLFQSSTSIKNINYNIDKNYIELNNLDTYNYLIDANPNSKPNLKMIEKVAKQLATITIYIANIRENLKIQAQKTYMKGTFNLLSFVINEYLCQFAKSTEKLNILDSILEYSTKTDSVNSLFYNDNCYIDNVVVSKDNIILSSVEQLSDSNYLVKISALPDNTSALVDNYTQFVDDIRSGISSEVDVQSVFNTINDQLIAIKSTLSSHNYDDVGIIEYNDVTEYFNIQTDTTQNSKDIQNINMPFWDEALAINTNTNFAFSDEQIQNFYKNVLNIGNEVTDLNDFLNTIYKSGASKTYVDKDNTLVINGDAALSDLYTNVFLKFNGQDYGYIPYYNYKNKTHSSYQIHPYLYNFINAANIISPIKNGFSSVLASQAVEDKTLSQLKTNIGQFGQIIDVWKNNSFEYTGYSTKYEQSTHKSMNNSKKSIPVIDYEGIFYPPAINDFINAPEYAIYSIRNPLIKTYNEVLNDGTTLYSQFNLKNKTIDKSSDETFYHKYYDHLNLNAYDREKIANALDEYKTQLIDIASEKTSIADVYDIYKYGTDMYDNTYMLLKKYSSANPSYNEKEDTPGTLWIRLKNHPIAFPAFFGENSVVDKTVINGELQNIAYPNIEDDLTMMSYFYDMEFDTSKRTILLNSCHQQVSESMAKLLANTDNNDEVIEDVEENEETEDTTNTAIAANAYMLTPGYRCREASEVIICNIEQFVEPATGKSILRLNEDTVSRYDVIESINGINCFAKEGDKMISFLGYMKNIDSIAPTFIVKAANTTKPQLIDNTTLSIYAIEYKYHSDSLTTLSGECNLYNINNSIIGDKYKAYSKLDSEIRMAYADGLLTLATMVDIPDNNISVAGYFGMINDQQQQSVYPLNANDTYKTISSNTSADNTAEVSTTEVLVKNGQDALNKHVAMIDFKRVGNQLFVNDVNLYNINSDASFIGVFPGNDAKIDLYKSCIYKNKVCNSFQLLGQYNDIEADISAINPDIDLNFDNFDLANSVSGRIFEDTNPENIQSLLNDTFKIYTNTEIIRLQNINQLTLKTEVSAKYITPEINSEDEAETIWLKNTTNWAYWTIPVDITDGEINNIDFVFLNTNITSKNAYFSGKLSSVANINPNKPKIDENGKVVKDENDNVVVVEKTVEDLLKESYTITKYNSEEQTREIPVNTDSGNIKITGTYNYFDKLVNSTDNNNIANVDEMRITFAKMETTNVEKQRGTNEYTSTTVTKNAIYVFMKLKSTSRASFISSNAFKFVFFNPCKLKIYEYFHMLDEMGAYNSAKRKLKLYDEHGNYTKTITLSTDLSNINFDNYKSLSSIPGLSGLINNISFKIDDESVFGINSPNFYYPGYNDKFPAFIGNMLSAHSTNVNTTTIFNDKNYFVVQLEDPIDLADQIGAIDIPVSKYSNYCLRAYEDYDPTQYDSTDAMNIQFVKFSTSNTFSDSIFKYVVNNKGEKVGIDFNKYKIFPGDNIDFEINVLQNYGLLHTTTEALEKDFDMDYVRFVANSSNTNLSNILNLYVNYNIEPDDSITLYFNYYNYLNSPFILMEDNHIKLYTIPGTYLKLKAGESGILNINCQFLVYSGQEIQGIKTATLVKYKIYNVSDDKPKFIVQRLARIQKDSLTKIKQAIETYISIAEEFINLDDDDYSSTAQIQYNQKVLIDSTDTINPGLVFDLYYNSAELIPLPLSSTNQFTIDTSDTGIVHVKTLAYITSTELSIPFKTVSTKKEIVDDNIYSYDIDIENVSGTYYKTNATIDPTTSIGGPSFGYETVLRQEINNENDLVLLENEKKILIKKQQYN